MTRFVLSSESPFIRLVLSFGFSVLLSGHGAAQGAAPGAPLLTLFEKWPRGQLVLLD